MFREFVVRISLHREVRTGRFARSFVDLPHQVETVLGKRGRIASVNLGQGEIGFVGTVRAVVVIEPFIRIRKIGIPEHIDITRRRERLLVGKITGDAERKPLVGIHVYLGIEIIGIIVGLQYDAVVMPVTERSIERHFFRSAGD